MKKKYFIGLMVAGVAGVLSSCNSGGIRRDPGKNYVPDMVFSRAYDAYTTNPVTKNGLTSQVPVEGTIARGEALPVHLTEKDTPAYYNITVPYSFSAKDIEIGKRNFNIYCGICHGTDLDGQGPLYTSGKFAAMPANLKSGPAYVHMTPGRIYYTIMYGKNMMGPYEAQLNAKQRWQVVAYIKKVQSENGGDAFNSDLNKIHIGAGAAAEAAPATATAQK